MSKVMDELYPVQVQLKGRTIPFIRVDIPIQGGVTLHIIKIADERIVPKSYGKHMLFVQYFDGTNFNSSKDITNIIESVVQASEEQLFQMSLIWEYPIPIELSRKIMMYFDSLDEFYSTEGSWMESFDADNTDTMH